MDADQVKRLIDQIGPHIDARYDYTYGPQFSDGRTDVCVVKRLCEDGSSYGYDTLYVVWEAGGSLRYRTIADSQSSKDYLHIDTVQEVGDEIVVSYSSGGSFSGHPWKRKFRLKKSDLGLA
jgi:hypothetical protein